VRVVLDTNVVISALLWGGQPLKLLELATDGTIILCTSPALVDELADVLARDHLALRVAVKVGSVERAVKAYAELAVMATPMSVPRVVPDDADDDHVIAAAVASDAQAIVSGDGDLLRLRIHSEIAIWTVAEALSNIEGRLNL
jgi:uncharacterized protein